MDGHCAVCGRKILVSIFKGTRWCSENHRKILAGEVIQPRPPEEKV